MTTREEIEAAQTPSGGYTREQLAKWGVPWPPPKGWRAALIEQDGTLGQPTKDTISVHLRQLHGYDMVYAVSAAPTVLMGEHDRIHETFDAGRINHTHGPS